jgi:predicted secreted protein
MNDDVSNPISPEQSKAQVIDAAKEIVGLAELKVLNAVFWRGSCNDQGDPPYRGEMRISHALAPSFQAADAEDAQMIQQLRNNGWTDAPDFHTHGTALKKNGVVAVINPQNASTPTRGVELFGECRDITSQKGTNSTETVQLSH